MISPHIDPPHFPEPPPKPVNKSASNIPQPKEVARPQDSSMFRGKSEITRGEFRQALKKNYQGSGMDASQRAKIEKRDFSSIYGSNISKTDIATSIHKLNQRILGSSASPQEKTQIKKDINYLKKISKP